LSKVKYSKIGLTEMKKIKISSEIFSEKNIKQALTDYKNITKASLKKGSTYHTVAFWKCVYDEELTVKEFENYLIGLENS
jgi:hypothetical protein